MVGPSAPIRRPFAPEDLAPLRRPAAALKTARALTDLRFTSDHIAKPEIAKSAFDVWAKRMRPSGAQPNLWRKLSGMGTKADRAIWTEGDNTPCIAGVLRIFGQRRCLMGTDRSVCLLAADCQRTVMPVRKAIARLPEPDHRVLLRDVAARLCRLARGWL